MNVDLRVFCEKLGKAENEAVNDSSNVSKYLMEHLYIPFMEGRHIRLDSLDYEAFEESDLEDFGVYLSDIQRVQTSVSGITEHLRQAKPDACLLKQFC